MGPGYSKGCEKLLLVVLDISYHFWVTGTHLTPPKVFLKHPTLLVLITEEQRWLNISRNIPEMICLCFLVICHPVGWFRGVWTQPTDRFGYILGNSFRVHPWTAVPSNTQIWQEDLDLQQLSKLSPANTTFLSRKFANMRFLSWKFANMCFLSQNFAIARSTKGFVGLFAVHKRLPTSATLPQHHASQQPFCCFWKVSIWSMQCCVGKITAHPSFILGDGFSRTSRPPLLFGWLWGRYTDIAEINTCKLDTRTGH